MTVFKVKVFVQDLRCKTGERLRSVVEIESENIEKATKLGISFFQKPKFRIEVTPATKTIKNLMSGKEIEIDSDTPVCCDPSYETYWSM